jgi:cation:H+ antiporter
VNDLSTVLILLACAAVIYVACEYFVNGIEWLGLRLGVNENAVGTVLAAFGTALPESVVTFVAVISGPSAADRQIGVGAALGGPLVLATVGYAVVGLSFLAFRARTDSVLLNGPEQRRLARDQAWFLGVFAVKVGLGFVAFRYKPWLGWAFLAAYALYTWREIRGDVHTGAVPTGDVHTGAVPTGAVPTGAETEAAALELEPLKLRPLAVNPPLHWILLQTLLALAVIFLGSELFVRQLGQVSLLLGLSPQLTALLLSPVATELPETLNAVIWLRQGKATLALGNISGSMLIQATVPSAFGLFFTPWLFDRALTVAAGVTFASVALMWWLLTRGRLSAAKLAWFASLYGVFVILVWGGLALARGVG